MWSLAVSTAGGMSASSRLVCVTGPEFRSSREMPTASNMAVGESCTCPIGTASTGRPASSSDCAAARSR